MPETGDGERSGTYQGHPVEDIEEGERTMESPLTGKKYRVTKWVEKDDGSAIALEKEEITNA